jgi:hypothetical protein
VLITVKLEENSTVHLKKITHLPIEIFKNFLSGKERKKITARTSMKNEGFLWIYTLILADDLCGTRTMKSHQSLSFSSSKWYLWPYTSLP